MKEIDFLRDHVQHLRHVRWFNTMPCIIPMSVAEHSFVTAVVAILMASDVNKEHDLKDGGEMVKAALLHDLEEGFTGDINALAKKLMGDFRGRFRSLQKDAMDSIILADAPKGGELMHYWSVGHKDELVKAADLVSMWLYAVEEVDLGNSRMRSVCYIVENWLRKLEEENDWLKPWATAIITENTFRGIRRDSVPESLRYVLND